VVFFALVLFSGPLTPGLATLGLTPLYAAVLVGAAQNIFSKSSKYSLFDPCKEMAYIPLDSETKVGGLCAPCWCCAGCAAAAVLVGGWAEPSCRRLAELRCAAALPTCPLLLRFSPPALCRPPFCPACPPPSSQTKGKAAIDVICNPLGKSGGALIQQFMIIGFGSLAASTPYLGLILLAVVCLWLFAAKVRGRRQGRVCSEQRGEAAGLGGYERRRWCWCCTRRSPTCPCPRVTFPPHCHLPAPLPCAALPSLPAGPGLALCRRPGGVHQERRGGGHLRRC
jgi:hypothetical protein